MMGHLGYLRGQAKKALRDARVEEMVYTMFNLEAHYADFTNSTRGMAA